MSLIENIQIENLSLEKLKSWNGHISIVLAKGERTSTFFAQIDELMQGNLKRCFDSVEFETLSNGEGLFVSFPLDLNATSLQVIKLDTKPNLVESRLAGGTVALCTQYSKILLILGSDINEVDVLYGFFLKLYKFDAYKTNRNETLKQITTMSKNVDELRSGFQKITTLLRGIYYTRDLINEPANTLNTIEFARRLKSLVEHGLKVEVLEEPDLERLGMRALLGVGLGSDCPSKVVVVKWEGGRLNEKPLLLVGKGVVFDSGGISLKPPGGMEEMTMDMGGAGVVAGTMKAIALRKSTCNVIALIGLVENMPDGKAQRPGDVVKSMKGDTIEVINTDAEGRLVLCDLLWYGQQYFSPSAIIDLATLTGAVIVALGHENAGVFSNNDSFCEQFLESAKLEGEGAWRLPLSPSYKKLLKSRVADIANVGGRYAGSVTAAKFLENFIDNDVPWIHIDIAGVAFSKNASKLSAEGATGWGVASLNRLISNYFEEKL